MSARHNVSNKDPIGMAMDGRLYSYLGKHIREPEVLARLRQETSTMPRAGMQIPPDEGVFMGMLVKLMGVKRYIEVGVFTGYSSLSVALSLPRDGKVVALDIDPAPIEVAKRYWAEAGVADLIDCRIAPGTESLANVTEEYGEDSFDMAFIDADKTSYRAYYEALLQLVKPGGLILIDNVLWFGKVADPNVQDEDTVAIRELNTFLKTDERIDFNIVAIGDGIAMCRKR